MKKLIITLIVVLLLGALAYGVYAALDRDMQARKAIAKELADKSTPIEYTNIEFDDFTLIRQPDAWYFLEYEFRDGARVGYEKARVYSNGRVELLRD